MRGRKKIGRKKCMNDKEFLCAYRMGRKSLKKIVGELRDHHDFINSQKTTKENKEVLEEHLICFLNFIGAFGCCLSNDNSHFKHEKGSGAHENCRNRTIYAIICSMKDECSNWTDENERKDIAHQAYQKPSFPNF